MSSVSSKTPIPGVKIPPAVLAALQVQFDDTLLIDASGGLNTRTHIATKYESDGLQYHPGVDKWAYPRTTELMEEYASLTVVMLDCNGDAERKYLKDNHANFNGPMKSFFVQVNDYGDHLEPFLSKKSFSRYLGGLRFRPRVKVDEYDFDKSYDMLSTSMNVATESSKVILATIAEKTTKQKASVEPVQAEIPMDHTISSVPKQSKSKIVQEVQSAPLTIEQKIINIADFYGMGYTKHIAKILNVSGSQYIAAVLKNNGFKLARRKMLDDSGKLSEVKVYVRK